MTATRRGAALLAALLLLSGCASAIPQPSQTVLRITPTPTPTPDPLEIFAQQRMASMTLEQKIRCMLMIRVPGLDGDAIAAVVAGEGLGGVILMGDNVPDPPAALAAMTGLLHGDALLPALVAIDQEGGVVRRIWTDEAPAAWQLRDRPAEDSRAAFTERAALLHALGVDINFGIVADVVGNPGSFLYDRSYGGAAADVAERVAAAVAGEHGAVLSTLKHFPGHGAAAGDSHFAIPSTEMGLELWRELHAPPFAAGIAAGAEVVMLGHLRFTAVDAAPASLSATWVRLLRDDLGFEGVIVTDDLSMLEHSEEAEFADQAGNAVRAVAAGVTMLLYVGHVDIPAVVAAVTAAIDAGALSEATIDDAVLRLLRLRSARGSGAEAVAG